MTQLSKEEHQAIMADMQAFDEQMPCVGIFWYDPANKVLFGVRKRFPFPTSSSSTTTIGTSATAGREI